MSPARRFARVRQDRYILRHLLPPLRGAAGQGHLLDEPHRLYRPAARGLYRRRPTPTAAPPRRCRTPKRRLYGVQMPPRGASTPKTASPCCTTSSTRSAARRATGRWATTPAARSAIPARKGRGRQGAARRSPAAWTRSVAAALLSKAVGSQLTCIFVDHGLMRKNEGDEVEAAFSGHRPQLCPGRCARPLPRQARGRDRPRAQAQDHRRGVHPRL